MSCQADLQYENFSKHSEMYHTVMMHLNVNGLYLIELKSGKFMASVLSVSLFSNMVRKQSFYNLVSLPLLP